MEVYFLIGIFLLLQHWVTGLEENKVCTPGFFLCKNTTICIPQFNYCDGKEDCPGGSDEQRIDCDDQGKDDYYDHQFKKRPSALNDHLGNICNLNYTGSCICRGRDLLCGHKNLDKIPGDLPQNITLLDFEGNNFPVLSGDVLDKVPQFVEKINFAHCNIDELKPHTFHQLTHIHDLHLDNNDLKTFPSDLFSQNNNLRLLSVTHNHISRISSDAFRKLAKLEELDLRGNKISEIKGDVLAPLAKLRLLYLQNNQIRYISNATFPRLSLDQLSLVENRIDRLDPGAFSNLTQLKYLYLTNNRLVHLKNGTFFNLTHLKWLALDDNFIKTIDVGVFIDVLNLTSLTLKRNQFKTLDKKVLAPLTILKHIYFDRFELCESALHVRDCNPKGDGISSQYHLLDNIVLRTSVWIMGVIGCTGNLIVLLGRLLAPTNNVVHSLYLRNLALSDLLMGVYLFAIAIADQHYRGEYLRYQYSWRHSYVCNFCGFLSTLSCESSVLILTLVTWDRFVSVTQPLARKQPSPKTAAFTLIVLWSIAAAVALAPLSEGYFGDEFYGNNGVCLPLHIHEPYAKGWEYSAAMFMLVNALALTFICYAYMRMINEIIASGVACRSTRQSQERDKVAQRFGIIIFTDCLCWVPVIVVKLVALAGYPIPQDLYAWLAIFILPINSALNPVLYTLTTTIFKKQMRKILNSCIRKRRAEPHSTSESGFSLSFGVFPKGGSTRRVMSYRGTQSSLTTSKNSWKRAPTAV
ncbi:relaxin receptor 2 [Tribolium madens]|uniref:relaxin receptor 2 n=1 Tax=Tribolium madens TaxID=41895 RepID=UPI001CF765B8|nr:relaxin receptor 2 [Tribolium madens]